MVRPEDVFPSEYWRLAEVQARNDELAADREADEFYESLYRDVEDARSCWCGATTNLLPWHNRTVICRSCYGERTRLIAKRAERIDDYFVHDHIRIPELEMRALDGDR